MDEPEWIDADVSTPDPVVIDPKFSEGDKYVTDEGYVLERDYFGKWRAGLDPIPGFPQYKSIWVLSDQHLGDVERGADGYWRDPAANQAAFAGYRQKGKDMSNNFLGPPTMTCRDCDHVIEVYYDDEPYLTADDQRLCQHMTDDDARRLEVLRLGDACRPNCGHDRHR
jgi:hypothetical protein